MGTAHLEKRRLRGILPACKFLMGENEGEVRLFLVVPTDRTRGNGCELKHMKSHLITRKLFFYYEGGQNWNGLS